MSAYGYRLKDINIDLFWKIFSFSFLKSKSFALIYLDILLSNSWSNFVTFFKDGLPCRFRWQFFVLDLFHIDPAQFTTYFFAHSKANYILIFQLVCLPVQIHTTYQLNLENHQSIAWLTDHLKEKVIYNSCKVPRLTGNIFLVKMFLNFISVSRLFWVWA